MSSFNAAWCHLLLCHVPIVAALIGWCLLVAGVWRKGGELPRVALVIFVAAAALTVPLYLTGEPAIAAIKGSPDFSDTILERHRSVAIVALAVCEILGLAALAGLAWFRGRPIARGFLMAMLAGAIVAGAAFVWTASLGGEIRHPEIRRHEDSASHSGLNKSVAGRARTE